MSPARLHAQSAVFCLILMGILWFKLGALSLWLLATPIVSAPLGFYWWSKFGAPYRYVRKDDPPWFLVMSAYLGNQLGLFPGGHWRHWIDPDWQSAMAGGPPSSGQRYFGMALTSLLETLSLGVVLVLSFSFYTYLGGGDVAFPVRGIEATSAIGIAIAVVVSLGWGWAFEEWATRAVEWIYTVALALMLVLGYVLLRP